MAEQSQLEEENSHLREMFEKARRYRGFEAWPCPLCVYENGEFIHSCAMHVQIDAMKNHIAILEKQACGGDAMNGYVCTIHEEGRQIYRKMEEELDRLYP